MRHRMPRSEPYPIIGLLTCWLQPARCQREMYMGCRRCGRQS